MATFYTLLTDVGQAKLANAVALGQTINITELAVGDGGGALPTPETDRTALVNEVRRAAINSSEVDPENPSWIIVEQVLPPEVGGWTIREIGIFDVDGDLIGYGNYPETYKPVLSEGSSRTQTVRFIMEVSDTAAVTLKVDPSVVLATREYADNAVADHAASRNHPAGTETEKGMVRLASVQRVKNYDAVDPVTSAVLRDSGFLGAAITLITSGDSPKSLAVAEAGLMIVDASAGDVDLNLPTATNNPGLKYTIVRIDDSTNNVTVTPDGTDTIDGAATLTIAPEDRRILACDGSSTWIRPEPKASESQRGMAPIASQAATDIGDDDRSAVSPKKLRWGFSANFSGNGYIAFPTWLGGFIFQWGGSSVSGGNGQATFTYPITFPNSVFRVFAMPYSGGNITAAINSTSVSNGSTTATLSRANDSTPAADGYGAGFFTVGN